MLVFPALQMRTLVSHKARSRQQHGCSFKKRCSVKWISCGHVAVVISVGSWGLSCFIRSRSLLRPNQEAESFSAVRYLPERLVSGPAPTPYPPDTSVPHTSNLQGKTATGYSLLWSLIASFHKMPSNISGHVPATDSISRADFCSVVLQPFHYPHLLSAYPHTSLYHPTLTHGWTDWTPQESGLMGLLGSVPNEPITEEVLTYNAQTVHS